jgi:hypothetical protein
MGPKEYIAAVAVAALLFGVLGQVIALLLS